MPPPIEVAVAVIQDVVGRVLLSKRPDHVHQGGLWEFPGGKLEPGESVVQALRREIQEELGIQIESHQPLIRLIHHYPDKSVALDVYRVLSYQGHPTGMEGQLIDWVYPSALLNYPMPEADRPIVTALRLPSQYLITGADPLQTEQFLRRLDSVVGQGCSLMQLRAPELDCEAFESLAIEVLRQCEGTGTQVLLNATPALAMRLDADGVHLNGERLLSFKSRPVPKGKWLAASCHNLQQLQQATKIDVDFAVLSPVCATTSHPVADVLGWDGFAAMVREAAFPVFALGGMSPANIEQSLGTGGQGIAAISALWPGT